MINSKLINILRTFSRNEIKEFSKFLSSPYFNGGRNYLPFFDELIKFYPRFSDAKMTPEYIYSRIYRDKPFNKQVIWNMTSSVLRIAEEFLMHLSLKKNKFIRNYLTADEMQERKLMTLYSKKLDELKSILDKMGIDESNYGNNILLESGRMTYHFLEDTQFMLGEHILKKGEYAVLYFIRIIADITCSLRTVYNTYNKKFDVNLPYEFIRNLDLKNIVRYSYEKKFRYAPLLEMYYCSIMTVIEPENTEHFFRLKEIFENNYSLFTKEESYVWAGELTNYCVNKINKGDQSFRKITFELDKFKLKEGLVYEGKFIPKFLFIQIFANALVTGEVEWSKNFIDEYIPKLKTSYQKPMHALANATMFFMLKDYDKVLHHLNNFKFIDGLDKLYARFFYIRIYYDRNETETLLNYIDSTRHFLSKYCAVGQDLVNNYVRFLGCLTRLVAARERSDDFEVKKIRDNVMNDSSMALREWLLEKTEELLINV